MVGIIGWGKDILTQRRREDFVVFVYFVTTDLCGLCASALKPKRWAPNQLPMPCGYPMRSIRHLRLYTAVSSMKMNSRRDSAASCAANRIFSA